MRRVYRFDKDSGEVYEAARSDPANNAGIYYMPDLDVVYNGGFRSPIDDSWISTRKQLRDHNRAHGVIQVGDVKPDEAKRHNLKKMQYDPAERHNPDFSWTKPVRP